MFAVVMDVPQDAADLSDNDLMEGQVSWATVDSPWLHKVDRVALAGELDGIRKMAPRVVLSGHLPAAPGRMIERISRLQREMLATVVNGKVGGASDWASIRRQFAA